MRHKREKGRSGWFGVSRSGWRGLTASLLLLSLLAGCSAPAKKGEPPGANFSDLKLEATATTGVLRGLVVDQAIRPIGGANVTVTPGTLAAKTTANGTFGFDGLQPGTYFIHVTKVGFSPVQSSADVVAGVAAPPLVRIQLVATPSTAPYVEAFHFTGFLTFGAAVFATSIGTTILGPVADALNDQSIWVLNFTVLPMWSQGELVWQQTQPLGGDFIWEMTDTSNTHYGYRETGPSPALAYWNTSVLVEHNKTTLDPNVGIAYRFFGGPHPLCTTPPPVPSNFGCGVTLQQKAEVYIHNFYNFVPPAGWRFTKDGDPVPPS